MDTKRKALLIGATGLIGSYLQEEILENSDYEQLTTFVRTPTNQSHPKLKEVVVSFDELAQYLDHFQVDDVFIALGTTRKKAGSKENFKKVDFDLVVESAKLAKSSGVTRIAIVSALGANENSSVFYNNVKGKMESAVKEIGIRSTYFFRPSLLLGDRKEFRFGEKIGEQVAWLLNPVLKGKWRKYQAVHGKAVAKAMIRFLKDARDGVHIVESDLIKKLFS
ncbi:hypothetical protein FIU87_07795 [Bacillus sp. THAF10]|uniref:NAD(P)H-binding protein n=1 Tax=Bacillus sp. THAF10 TaxID=2587848 RepID=UPI001267A966|nr:NAD(P)H-binding protein [Bacillus sp. THAF10]QFT88540.1 hypothetical protein FIU87_07795 [Bacillus sp. THAF10]